MDYDYRKEFISDFNILGRKYDRWTVWSDFLDVFAKCLQLPFYSQEAREVIKKVSKKYGEDYKVLDKLATHVINALEHKIQDFLGSIFMELELANKLNGQFFTPYDLCLLMVQMQTSDITMEKINNAGGFIKVSDPCIGGGAMLLAFCEMLKNQGINYQEYVYFHAQDIDQRCCNMAYIQLSLIGVVGEIVTGNTLTMEIRSVIKTPLYFIKKFWIKEQLQDARKLMNCATLTSKNKLKPKPKEPQQIVKKFNYDADKQGQLIFTF